MSELGRKPWNSTVFWFLAFVSFLTAKCFWKAISRLDLYLTIWKVREHILPGYICHTCSTLTHITRPDRRERAGNHITTSQSKVYLFLAKLFELWCIGVPIRNLTDILGIFEDENIPDRDPVYLKMEYSCIWIKELEPTRSKKVRAKMTTGFPLAPLKIKVAARVRVHSGKRREHWAEGQETWLHLMCFKLLYGCWWVISFLLACLLVD